MIRRVDCGIQKNPIAKPHGRALRHATCKSTNANSFARDPEGRVTGATAIGINALKPIMHFQVSLLRMWADSIERLAGNYEKGVEETVSAVDEQSDQERAA